MTGVLAREWGTHEDPQGDVTTGAETAGTHSHGGWPLPQLQGEEGAARSLRPEHGPADSQPPAPDPAAEGGSVLKPPPQVGVPVSPGTNPPQTREQETAGLQRPPGDEDEGPREAGRVQCSSLGLPTWEAVT